MTRGSLDENMLELATAKLQLDAEVSGGKEGEAEGAEGAAGQTERRMKKSLLSGLKKQFERETAQVAERQQEEKAKIEEIEAEAKTDAPAKAEGDGEEAPKPDANAEAEPEPVKPEEAAA